MAETTREGSCRCSPRPDNKRPRRWYFHPPHPSQERLFLADRASCDPADVTPGPGHDPVSSPADRAHRRRRLTVASIGRRGWRQAKSALTTKFDRRVTLPVADTLERVTRLQDQVGELTEIIRQQVETANETTELLGRLLATASSRLDAVEESLGQITAAEMAPDRGQARNRREHEERASRRGTSVFCPRGPFPALRLGHLQHDPGPRPVRPSDTPVPGTAATGRRPLCLRARSRAPARTSAACRPLPAEPRPAGAR